MRRSQFLKHFGGYSLGSGVLAVGLHGSLLACTQTTVRSEATEKKGLLSEQSNPPSTRYPQQLLPTETGPWRVAIASSFRLFAMKHNNQLEGFEPDLIEAIAQACNVEVQIESQPFDALLPLMQAGDIDIALGAMPIPGVPVEGVVFSQPYFRSGVAIAALPENEQLNTLDALSGQAIAVVLGSSGARLPFNIPGTRILTYSNVDEALFAVANKEADAALVSLPLFHQAIRASKLKSTIPDSQIAEVKPMTEAAKRISEIQQMGRLIGAYDIGIMVRASPDQAEEGSRLTCINAAIETLQEDGTYDEIYARWWEPATD